MSKFFFIFVTLIVVGIFFYNDPQKLPWVDDSFNEEAGYSVYSQAECRNLDCAIVRQFQSLAQCREQVLKTYELRKQNPTVAILDDRAYCYTDCVRKTNGELRDLDIGTCDIVESVKLSGF